MSIASNLQRIRNEIADACAKCGRSEASVALMAVSKMHPAAAIEEAYATGQRLFGENRVQEAQAKLPVVSALTGLDFHLIGPLQNNKTAKAAEIFHSIDTLDATKTAERLNNAAATSGKVLRVVIEIKLSHEESKHGLDPLELPAFLVAMKSHASLEISGLMTVPPWSEDPETARPYFQHLRQLRDQNQPQFPSLIELSMGMSNDFRVAIEEGSTTVRLGTAIFGKRMVRQPDTEP